MNKWYNKVYSVVGDSYKFFRANHHVYFGLI